MGYHCRVTSLCRRTEQRCVRSVVHFACVGRPFLIMKCLRFLGSSRGVDLSGIWLLAAHHWGLLCCRSGYVWSRDGLLQKRYSDAANSLCPGGLLLPHVTKLDADPAGRIHGQAQWSVKLFFRPHKKRAALWSHVRVVVIVVFVVEDHSQLPTPSVPDPPQS